LWEASFFLELKNEKKHMLDFMKMCLGPNRLIYDPIYQELKSLDEDFMKEVCKNFVQYSKDVHVLNTYRYNMQVLGSQITQEII